MTKLSYTNDGSSGRIHVGHVALDGEDVSPIIRKITMTHAASEMPVAVVEFLGKLDMMWNGEVLLKAVGKCPRCGVEHECGDGTKEPAL